MLIPLRMRVVCAIAVTAFACHYAAAQPAPTMTPEQIVQWAQTLPPGTQIEFEHVTASEKASGEGASLEASGDKANTDIDSSAPTAALSGGAKSSGGTAKGGASALQYQFSWLPILCWIAGVGCLAFAGWQFKLGSIKNATSFAVVGAAFIAVGFFPALLLVGLAGIAVWLLIQSGVLSKVATDNRKLFINSASNAMVSESQAHENYEALRAVAAGVSDLKDVDPVAHAKVLGLIARHADENDKATIKAVRRADDLN